MNHALQNNQKPSIKLKENFKMNLCKTHQDSVLTAPVTYGDSVFKPGSLTRMKFADIVAKIREENEIAEKVHIIRSTGNPEERIKIKNSLAWFTFNLFNGKRNNEFFASTQFLIFDLDKLDNLDEIRKQLEAWIYTSAVFLSPSGKGLKLIIKLNIPLLTNRHYYKVYLQIMEDIEKKFNVRLDPSTKDPARACYLSHDPDIYINEYADEYTINESMLVEEENKTSSFNNSNKRENVLQFFKGVDEGSRHNAMLSLVATLKARNLDHDFIRTIAYSTNLLNNPPFTDEEFSKEFSSILSSLAKNEIPPKEEIFWEISNSKNRPKAVIKPAVLIDFLTKHGFYKYALSKNDIIFVRVINNILYKTSIADIKEFIQNYLNGLVYEFKDSVREAVIKSHNIYLTKQTLHFLSSLNPRLKRGNKENAYLFFKNAFLKITSESISTHSYDELNDEYVWNDSIINRNIDINALDSALFLAEYNQLLRNVCRNEEQWYNALSCAIGYLAHDYKDKSNARAIILCDEEISLADDSNGGTGKSLICSALKHIKNTEVIDGKNFRTDSPFIFQKVDIDTEVVLIDDVRKNFDFESLLSAITSDLTIEKKNQKPQTIPFEESPKFIITTNYTISGNGNSYDRRKHEIEFSNYYNSKWTPRDDFGHNLFDEWPEDEWTWFYLCIAIYVQRYLKHGLMKYEIKNLSYRRAVNSTSQEFIDFALDHIEVDKEYIKRELWDEFKNRFPEYTQMRSNKFTNWLKTYANNFQLKYNERKSNEKRFISFRR